jgi:hypothetical protein
MENLIEQSFLIDNNSANIKADGTRVPMHKSVSVKILDGDCTLYYNICRGNGISGSYINMEKFNNYYRNQEKSYWKFYDDNAKFERAIKRIEKMIK